MVVGAPVVARARGRRCGLRGRGGGRLLRRLLGCGPLCRRELGVGRGRLLLEIGDGVGLRGPPGVELLALLPQVGRRLAQPRVRLVVALVHLVDQPGTAGRGHEVTAVDDHRQAAARLPVRGDGPGRGRRLRRLGVGLQGGDRLLGLGDLRVELRERFRAAK